MHPGEGQWPACGINTHRGHARREAARPERRRQSPPLDFQPPRGGEHKTHRARGVHELAPGAGAALLADGHLGRVEVSAAWAISHLGSVLAVCWLAG